MIFESRLLCSVLGVSRCAGSSQWAPAAPPVGGDGPGEGGSQPASPEGAPLRQGPLVSICVGNARAQEMNLWTMLGSGVSESACFFPHRSCPVLGMAEAGCWRGWKWAAARAGDGASPSRKRFQWSLLSDSRKSRRWGCGTTLL